MAKESGAASTDKEAMRLATALQRAGVVLQHNGWVYLRPLEVAEAIREVLPGEREEALRKLNAVEAELAELDKAHREIDRLAQRRIDTFLLSGLNVLMVQFAAFFYLTYWELNWNVMGPISYFVTSLYGIMAYIYFIITKGGSLDLPYFRNFWYQRFKERRAQALKFDEDRYHHLLKLRERYAAYLKHARLP